MTFTASASETDTIAAESRALYFLFDTAHILVDRDNALPCLDTKEAEKRVGGSRFFFGTFNALPCYCAALAPGAHKGAEPPSLYKRLNLRAFFLRADDTAREMAGYARQILDLHLNSRFCGRCGTPTRTVSGEHARKCPACGHTAYPRISPAMITAVTKDDKILLARGINFPNKKMFSVLAGFVSPSETLEDCVRREVFEETRIRVDRVRYVRSQPWPFPDSLMIGFTARYQSGEIRIDPEEIAEAAWFAYDDLPLIPDAHTLAGQLIREFARQQHRKHPPA